MLGYFPSLNLPSSFAEYIESPIWKLRIDPVGVAGEESTSRFIMVECVAFFQKIEKTKKQKFEKIQSNEQRKMQHIPLL